MYLWDAEGRRYLDFSGSAAVSMIGHGDAEVTRAIAEQAAALEFVHSSQFTTAAAEQFAAELLEFAGPGFRSGAVYFTSGGSEAIESALKLARQYQVEVGQPARYRMLSRRQSYHGSTLGAMQVSGNRRRRDLYLPMMREQADFEHVDLPYCYRCKYGCQDCSRQYAAEVEQALAAAGREAAAFVLEPVSGATLGAAVPPDGYLQQVAAACARAGVLLIADEVMTGCGRTGRNFAVEHWSVTPDLMVLGKGLSSGYTPLGAVIATRRVVDAIAAGTGAFVHGFTYNAHPVSVAGGRTALARLRTLQLVQAADSTQEGTAGSALRSALQQLRVLPAVGDVRGLGLLWGVEFVADKASKAPFPPERGFAFRVSEAAARRGLLVYPMQGCVDGERGDHLLLAPPAVISPQEIGWAVERLAAAIDEAAGGETGKPAGKPS